MRKLLYSLMMLLALFVSCNQEKDEDETEEYAYYRLHTRSSVNLENVGDCKVFIFDGNTGNFVNTATIKSSDTVISFRFWARKKMNIAFIANSNAFLNTDVDAYWRYLNYYDSYTQTGSDPIPAFAKSVVTWSSLWKQRDTVPIYFGYVENFEFNSSVDSLDIDLKPVEAKFTVNLNLPADVEVLNSYVYTPIKSYLYDRTPKLNLSSSTEYGEGGTLFTSRDIAFTKVASAYSGYTTYTGVMTLLENLAGKCSSNATYSDYRDNGVSCINGNASTLTNKPTYLFLKLIDYNTRTQKEFYIFIGKDLSTLTTDGEGNYIDNGILNITDYNVNRNYHYHYNITVNASAFSTSSVDEPQAADSELLIESSVEKL